MTATTDCGDYVRGYYKVPAHIGGRITFTDDGQDATIVGFDGPHILVQFDTDTDEEPAVLHPTWKVTYHAAEVAR